MELFLTSEPGWDGCDGKPASREAVRDTLQVLQYLRLHGVKTPCLFMGSSGEIEVAHISKDRKTYLNLEMQGDSEIMVGWFDGEHAGAAYVYHVTEIPELFIQAMRELEEKEYGPTDEIGNPTSREPDSPR